MFKFIEKIKNKSTKNKYKNNVEMIAVPELRSYIIKGYEEITQIKKDHEKLENDYIFEKAEKERYKQLYEATLVTTKEFSDRYDADKLTIERLKKVNLSERQNYEKQLSDANNSIDELKEKVFSYENNIKKIKTEIKEEIKEDLTSKIKQTKGHLTKDIILSIIKSI